MLKRMFAAACAVLFAFAALAQPALAAGVSVDIKATLTGAYSGSNDLGAVTFRFNETGLNRLTPGTAAQKADKMLADQRTLAASATENLDLAGTLADPLGVTVTFAKVKAIYVRAAAANTNNVCVGGAASNAFVGPFADATDVVCVRPGGVLLVTAPAGGWTVTASTGDLLKVANSGAGTGVTYDVIIIGTSA